MVATACPSADELKNYTLGRLSEQDWAAIADHVESCPQCQAAIATVDDIADTLVTQLREPAPEDSFLNESQCEAALKRARVRCRGGRRLPVEVALASCQCWPKTTRARCPCHPTRAGLKVPLHFHLKRSGNIRFWRNWARAAWGPCIKRCKPSSIAWWRSKSFRGARRATSGRLPDSNAK